MHTQLIAPLDAPGLPLHLAGGKGANLNAMLCAGLPVPPGFVVLTAAYQQYVADNGLAGIIAEQWAACDPARPATFETASQTLRAAFLAGALSDEIATAITADYAQLGPDAAVAVRSSATAEDLPEASFAGQQDTYLNVRGAPAVIEAVRRCWGSLWTARAMAYRMRQGIAPAEVSLAVVVQQMAPATAAGVLFTVNPVSGDQDEMVINATWGLGEALVSGQVTPDNLVVDKATAAIKQLILGDKQVMTAATAEGTAEMPVAPELQAQQAVDASQVAELVRLGRALEAHFGKPQDVEWAIAAGEVVLLQARPITTVAPAAEADAGPAHPPGDDQWPPLDLPPQPFDLWTTYDVGERWPEPVTPFSWSTGYAMIQQNMNETLEGMKAPYAGKIQWARRAFGHVYLNEGALAHAYPDGLGMPMGMIASSLTGIIPVTPANNRYQWSKIARHLPFYWRTFTQWEKNVQRYVADFPTIDAAVDAFMARDLAVPSDQELWREAQEVWLAQAMHYMRAHSNATSLSLTAYSQMEEFTARWMDDRSLTPKLAGGLSGVIAAEIVPALWQLAQQIDQLGLAAIVLEQPPAAALATLHATPAAQPVLAQLAVFLARHGHRCMSEAEWLHPRWVEAPHLVIESLAGYLRAGSSFDPRSAIVQAEEDRLAATAALEERLNPWQRRYFHWLLGRMQRLTTR